MTTTAVPAVQPTAERKRRLNRWDSPWLNPKFLIGFSMVVVVALMGVNAAKHFAWYVSYQVSGQSRV